MFLMFGLMLFFQGGASIAFFLAFLFLKPDRLNPDASTRHLNLFSLTSRMFNIMSTQVDHNQRRVRILERAFELFAEKGYSGVTYQKIADRCEISRTTIYRYFQNKEQIFNFAIKLSTGKINSMVEKVLDRKDWSPREKTVRVLHITVKLLADNRVFLTVVLDYLLSQKNSGADVRRKVRRHTFGMIHLLERLLKEAHAEKQLYVPDPGTAAGHLYGMLESLVLNITVTNIFEERDFLKLIDNYIEQLIPPETNESVHPIIRS